MDKKINELPTPKPVIVFTKGKLSDMIVVGFPDGKTNKPKTTQK